MPGMKSMKTSRLRNRDGASAFFGAVLVAKWAAYGNGANFRPCLRQHSRPECPLNSLGGMRAREEGRGRVPGRSTPQGAPLPVGGMEGAEEGVGVGWLAWAWTGNESGLLCCLLRPLCKRRERKRGMRRPAAAGRGECCWRPPALLPSLSQSVRRP